MDELEAIFDKLRKCMAGRVSESVLIEVDVAEIRMQQLLLRAVAKASFERQRPQALQYVEVEEVLNLFDERGVLSEPTKKWKN